MTVRPGRTGRENRPQGQAGQSDSRGPQVHREIDRRKGRRLLELRQHHRGPAPARPEVSARRIETRNIAGRQALVRAFIVVQSQADLLQIIDALSPSGRLACRLYGGQEQGTSTPMMEITTNSSISVNARTRLLSCHYALIDAPRSENGSWTRNNARSRLAGFSSGSIPGLQVAGKGVQSIAAAGLPVVAAFATKLRSKEKNRNIQQQIRLL